MYVAKLNLIQNIVKIPTKEHQKGENKNYLLYLEHQIALIWCFFYN